MLVLSQQGSVTLSTPPIGSIRIDGTPFNDSLKGSPANEDIHGGEGDDHYEIHGRTDLTYDSGGHDSGTIRVDWYKADPAIEDWTWAPGVKKLPYWIDALVYDRLPFVAATLGPAHTIGYAFAQTPPRFFSADDQNGFKPFNAAQITYTKAVLAYIETVLNVHFVETTDTEGDGTIVFANNKQEDSAGWGYALQPAGAGSRMLVGQMRNGIAYQPYLA